MSSLNRRQFLSLSATLSAGILVAPTFLRAQSPSKKLNLAVIGASGKGADNLGKFMNHNIVALCDVDSNGIAKAKQQILKGQGAAFAGKEYRAYRKLFDDLKHFDAVVNSTPEHHH
jgi:predicted dehydrogenase